LNLDEFNYLLGRNPSIDSVWVQVKSSRTGANHFKAQIGQTPEEIDRQLSEDRLILINTYGGSSKKIQESFVRQLIRINNFWYTR